jgi:type II secretory pathway component PulC
VVRYAERSLPLDYHRHARQAAEAAECALEQGNYWRFHDLLYAEGGTPDRAMLDRVSRGANLEPEAFATCLDSGQGARAVAADVALAGSLKLTTVPAVFVNGLYASPDVTAADLVWLIDRELASLNVASPRLVPATTRTNAPFELKGLLVSRVPGQSVAVVTRSIAPDRGMLFREGDAMATGVVLRRIDANGIDLAHDGKVERLPVGARPAAPVQAVDDSAAIAAANPHQAVPVTLDRNRVLVLLSDRIALAHALEPVPMTAGGQRLMKLQVVAPGSLYELLGLQPGDVILGVNEQPVTETVNPLWDALQTQDEVRLRVMRRGGLARHYTYRFDK